MHILTNRLKRGLCGVILGGSLIFAGCATTGPRDVKGVNPEQDAKDAAGKTAQDDKTSIEYINVVGAGDRVLIGTTGSIKYTVFKLSAPSRLIVDMPKVDIGKVPPSIKVDNDFVKEIAASTYGADNEIGRIVITLKDGVDHEIKSGENSILVSLKKEGGAEGNDSAKALPENQAQKASDAPAAPAAPATADAAPAVEPAGPAKAAGNAPAASTGAAKAEPPADVKQAAKILKIESAKDGKNSVIIIQTDGAIGNYNSFGLDSPSRIVMDIWGVDNGLGRDILKMKDKYVRTVRVGNYPDKTRLVFDLGRKMPPHAIKKSGNNIILTMGAGAAEGQSKAASNGVDTRVASLGNVGIPNAVKASNEAPAGEATTPAEAPAKEVPAAKGESVVIEGVDFRKADGAGRLTIRGSAKLDYSVKESDDGKSVIFDIKNATIPAELERTLDAAKLNTAVLAISSFQQSAGPVKDVRILVKLKDKAPYSVNSSGATIDVDFRSNTAAAETVAEKEAKPEVAEGARKEFNGKKIDLDMTDANITDVLRLLAEVSNLNIVASDDVRGTISLRLKNVPWDQAFDIILKSKGLDSIKKGNVIMVAPVDKIKQEKEAALTSKKVQEKLEDLEIIFIPVNYANVKELTPQVKGVLSDRGSVTSDLRTNTLIVKDIKSGRDASYALVRRLDTAIPQVLIEARIVEASTNYLRDLGIQWGVDFQTGGKTTTNTFGSTVAPGQTPPGTNLTGTPAFTDMHGVQDFAVNVPASNALGALGFVLGKAGGNPAVLDLRISAGEQEGRLRTISRPRITTMDNKEAKIQQGESVPFQTTSAAGTATTFVDANLSLTVTPHITPDGSILMKIKANNNAIGSFKTSTGAPSISKKEASTEVLVRDGETTVLGGIIVSGKNETHNGIPLLKDIPIIGWLFKNSEVTNNQQELLIFITPTILHEKTVG